jgi:YVTN family beta-propeller protein
VDESTLPPPDRSADGIGVVDAKALKVVTILRGPSDPEQTSVSRDGARLYIANEDTGKASVLDIATGKTVAEFVVGGEPEGVTTSADGRFVYVTSEEDNTISVIDTAANKMIKQFAVGARPRDSAFSPDGSRAYVTAENGGTVSVVDTSSHTVIVTIPLSGPNVRPMGVVVSPDGQRVYVTTGRGGTVVAIDAKTNQSVGSFMKRLVKLSSKVHRATSLSGTPPVSARRPFNQQGVRARTGHHPNVSPSTLCLSVSAAR